MSQHSLSLRDMAKEIGCDHSTVHRVVRGEPCRMDMLLLILVWLIGKDVNHL